MDTLLVAPDKSVKQIPNLELPQLVHRYEIKTKHSDNVGMEDLKNSIITEITNDNMAAYYQQICSKFSWVLDDELYQKLRFAYYSKYLPSKNNMFLGSILKMS